MAESLELLALVIVGALAGFLNVTAGGGSLLTLPFLIFLGLPAGVANGTNRIAILAQNIFATARFHHFDVIPRGLILATTLPAIAGALVGAQLAIEIDELLFKRVLAVVMVGVAGFMFFGRKPRQLPQEETRANGWKLLAVIVSFFVIGIYGGFIQGGIGFLLITALTLTGYDLVKTNALKVLIVLVYTPFALAIFIWNGQVDFARGIMLAAGNATGAWFASRVVVEKGHAFLRWIVMFAILGFAIKLLW